MTDLDAYSAAAFLIYRRDDPEMFAAVRVGHMMMAGNVEGEAAWKRILIAIHDLQTKTPHAGESVN